ncbi:hypothetical protein [Providencia sp. T47]|uniref:hypothetical protein n=1 Tax=Providencia sp. T47 TaxID=3395376 RepID=UPI0039BD7901
MMKFNNCIRPILFVSSLLLYSTTSFAANLPIKVDAKGDELRAGNVAFPIWRYTITSLDDNITLQSLVLNRNNCLISTNDRGQNTNAKLKFGQSYTFTSPSNSSYTQCKPLELIVNTNKGSYTFTW